MGNCLVSEHAIRAHELDKAPPKTKFAVLSALALLMIQR